MKNGLKFSLVLALATVLLVGCSCYDKMIKNASQVTTSCAPEVLSLKGSKVPAEITVTFPAKYFNKGAILKVTPVLVYEGGEIAGEAKFLQGEKVKDNYTVIPYTAGGSYTQKVAFDYIPDAVLSTLELRIEGKCLKGKKAQEFTPVAAIPVAQGVSTVQLLAQRNLYTCTLKDNFKRVYSVNEEADIMYLINSSSVRKNQISNEGIATFKAFIQESINDDRTTMGNVYAKGYASPDGTVSFNDQLSKRRSKSGEVAIKRVLKGIDVKYDIASYGEDWEGFKKLVEASNIEDKALILQVLKMYDNPVKRDQEIQNMSAVFKVLATEVLPQLRRTQLVADAQVENLTDAELKAAVAKGCKDLNLEQAMFAGTLYNDSKTKIAIYTYAAEKFNCYRAYNNLGVAYLKINKVADARKALNAAAAIKPSTETTVNLAVAAIIENKLAEAKRYLSSINTPMAVANKALIALLKGDYATAAKGLKGLNKAVAEVCNGDLAAAKKTIATDKSETAAYIKAIIAMREGRTETAMANLKFACKNKGLQIRAKKDVEFAKVFGEKEFLAL